MTTPASRHWTIADMPDLTGRTAVVTGANSGLGFETAAALAARGANVTMAVRTVAKGEEAAARIRERLAGAAGSGVPAGSLEVHPLDLADLSSVRAFAAAWIQAHPGGLDLLINNAGLMAIPRRETADGFEMQLGTNHLGHFALTGLMLGSLRPEGRVVSVASLAHRMGRITFDDLMREKRYTPFSAYGQSKLANLLFTYELQRRLARAGMPVSAMAAHPGYAATHLQAVGPEMTGKRAAQKFMDIGNSLVAQSAAMGALPTLYAATLPGLPGGSYIGPGGFLESRGYPRVVHSTAAARDEAVAARLWEVSATLTGVSYLP